MKDKFPDAMVIGADNSDEMLAKAKKTHPDIEFIHLDVGGDLGVVKGKFDIVFSKSLFRIFTKEKKGSKIREKEKR